ASAGPSARAGHAMAYDASHGVTTLFGGTSVADTWEWNGTTWAQRASTGPSTRGQHAMAYDASRRVTVLFGGGPGYLGDTWEWNGARWTQRASTGPSARYQHAMVYDLGRRITVMFGGDGAGICGDTWEYLASPVLSQPPSVNSTCQG